VKDGASPSQTVFEVCRNKSRNGKRSGFFFRRQASCESRLIAAKEHKGRKEISFVCYAFLRGDSIFPNFHLPFANF
jgi:hypothetical protein